MTVRQLHITTTALSCLSSTRILLVLSKPPVRSGLLTRADSKGALHSKSAVEAGYRHNSTPGANV